MPGPGCPMMGPSGLTCETPVTAGLSFLFCGAAGVMLLLTYAEGAWEVSMADGLSSFAAGVACEACPAAASLVTHTTLELGHLCFLAVLRDANFCPHAMHCCSHVGSLTTFAASRSRSHLEAQLRFHASRFFSLWVLLALQPPFWRSKKASLPFLLRSSKTYANITFFTLLTG
jgi:hypothetical protein